MAAHWKVIEWTWPNFIYINICELLCYYLSEIKSFFPHSIFYYFFFPFLQLYSLSTQRRRRIERKKQNKFIWYRNRLLWQLSKLSLAHPVLLFFNFRRFPVSFIFSATFSSKWITLRLFCILCVDFDFNYAKWCLSCHTNRLNLTHPMFDGYCPSARAKFLFLSSFFLHFKSLICVCGCTRVWARVELAPFQSSLFFCHSLWEPNWI